MQVNRENITKAFVLAHRASDDAQYPAAVRHRFRAIANQIWHACGECPTDTAPDTLPTGEAA